MEERIIALENEVKEMHKDIDSLTRLNSTMIDIVNRLTDVVEGIIETLPDKED